MFDWLGFHEIVRMLLYQLPSRNKPEPENLRENEITVEDLEQRAETQERETEKILI